MDSSPPHPASPASGEREGILRDVYEDCALPAEQPARRLPKPSLLLHDQGLPITQAVPLPLHDGGGPSFSSPSMKGEG